MLAQCRSLTDAQLSTCRVTPEQDYAIEDVLAASFPARPENQALLEALHADPIPFANLGLCIKRSSWNDATVYVAPLADALKFADIQTQGLRGIRRSPKPTSTKSVVIRLSLFVGFTPMISPTMPHRKTQSQPCH
jgi:hypothetical protein